MFWLPSLYSVNSSLHSSISYTSVLYFFLIVLNYILCNYNRDAFFSFCFSKQQHFYIDWASIHLVFIASLFSSAFVFSVVLVYVTLYISANNNFNFVYLRIFYPIRTVGLFFNLYSIVIMI